MHIFWCNRIIKALSNQHRACITIYVKILWRQGKTKMPPSNHYYLHDIVLIKERIVYWYFNILLRFVWFILCGVFKQEFETRWISVELIYYVKTIIVFHNFYNFFWWQHSLKNQPCYNNLFQIMQYKNFLKLNGMVFTLESRVSAFWYCFKAIKQYTFLYLMKLILISGN